MAALFSIVQDPHPPLPDGISMPIKDFLLLCFQKEPAMRSTAAVLLNHPWLQQAMLVAPRKPENSPAAFYFASTSNSPALSSQDSSPARSRIHTNSRPTPSASPPIALEDRKLDLGTMKASRSPRIQPSLTIPKSANIRSDDNYNPNLLVTIRSPKHSNSSAQCESESKGEAVMLVVKPTAAAGVGKSLIGLFDSGVDACPAPREVAMQRNSINMNDKGAVNRMMSFELPEEKDSWSNGDTGFTDLEHVTMLSQKQMSSVTVSCSSLLEGGPTSTSLSSATGSAHEDEEDETEYTKVRVSRQIPLFCRSNSQRSQNALSESGRDEDSMNDMRLSIDDEVDERRGLYILRKALQSGNFLDHEEGHGGEGEGDGEGVSDAMRPPKKRLSLLLADNDDELDDSGNSLDQELNSRLRHMDVKSVASFDGFDDITTVSTNTFDTCACCILVTTYFYLSIKMSQLIVSFLLESL